MENEVVRKRLAALREQMAKRKMDYYLIPTADFHNSEYVSDYFKVREYFCNFSGSNGTLVVWRDGAGLWTDGRYFIRAQKELEGTGVCLYRMQEEGVPTIEEFLCSHMRPGEVLGFDGRVLSAKSGCRLERALEKALREKADKEQAQPGQELSGKNLPNLCYEEDLADFVWQNRPPFPAGSVYVIGDDIAGKSIREKLKDVRGQMTKDGAEAFLLTKLDDIMWLFNLRGCDVECNPVAMSYAYVTQERAVLFLQKSIFEEKTVSAKPDTAYPLNFDCRSHLEAGGVEIEDYWEIEAFIKRIPPKTKVLADIRHCNYRIYKTLSECAEVVDGKNPTELLKAIKNPTELSWMEKIYLKDSVALTKFIYWLKTNIGKTEITEISAADKLEEFRREIPEFIDLSFPTIAGYGANAAMMHYEATKENHAVLKPEGMLLVDSGGQYMGGTTDVTRTIALGPVSDAEKYHYTLVAMGMLKLSAAHWLYGCSGRNLDILARQYLWDAGIDYKCGTGHGVGYLLNVHEGPQNLKWRFPEGASEVPFEEGMDVTNEPGVYVEGSHGIRIENVMVVRKDSRNEYGQFMHFDTLTWVPLDPEVIDFTMMPKELYSLLADYQKTVREKLSPYLNEEEREWLKKETQMGAGAVSGTEEMRETV